MYKRQALTLPDGAPLDFEAAEWSLANEHDGRARAAALRFAATPIDHIADADPRGDAALANDEPLPVV